MREHLKQLYDDVRKCCRTDLSGELAANSILDLAIESIDFLNHHARRVGLKSKVAGKQYSSFRMDGVVARPANSALFVSDPQTIETSWRALKAGSLDSRLCDQLLYTLSLAPCLAMELFDRQNKKGPATYFECLVGHLVSSLLRKNPARKARLPVLRGQVRMTMDFLFEGGSSAPGVHLPIKMSTRERVVQAWSHQRLLDSAFGEGFYRGIMVLCSETKMDSRSHEVVEICVPGQWLAYQTYLAKMEKIYYLDMPERYKELTESNPEVIEIRPFSDLFLEQRRLRSS